MNWKWTSVFQVGVILTMLVVGCRTTQPDLKPPKQPEVLNPPSETANLTGYPKQAFAVDDSTKKNFDPSNPSRNPQQPASFGGPSPGGPGGFGGGPGGPR